MISLYTISIDNRDIIIEKDKEYNEKQVYIDQNKLYLGNYIKLIIDDGEKKKRKKIELDHKYVYTIGISFYNNAIFLHMNKHMPFVDNQFKFDFIEEVIIKI